MVISFSSLGNDMLATKNVCGSLSCKTLNVDNKFYSKKVIDAQVIFHEERKSFNPDNC